MSRTCIIAIEEGEELISSREVSEADLPLAVAYAMTKGSLEGFAEYKLHWKTTIVDRKR
jgi:hypothetical protein